ncbi:CYTH domain-containing protein [Enhydrobacter aerosaccus]|uniref:CYTH domain-containing protein n=1 Tax=Enhydrobacter aerosaccus TaxID=225324 RepID=A0A1T4T0K3_9HYPH|nr:CYTH and CHAD domain-containing protein [Enhydrobacter aerosaccus]SKA34020.1 CYTH domain-containing protein [Enhydrobacter aerosaccus]
METELKFSLSRDARRALERHMALRGNVAGEAATRTDHTTYFDTSDFALRNAGFSLRIRRSVDGDGGDTFVQTVKAAQNGAGKDGSGWRRQEWEWPVAREELDLEHLDEVPGLLPALQKGLADLQPVFCTEVQRCRQVLQPPGGGLIELALDDGMIVASRQREPVSELELELKEGSEDALLRLGLDLAQAAPLSLQVESKADRGYRLQEGDRPRARKAGRPAIDGDATAARAFASLSDSVLDHLLVNQPAVLRGEESEGVHQMRVAVRRLRSLLVLYTPLLERTSGARFEAELRRLGNCLGAARDWSVFLEQTLPAAEKDGVDANWIEILRLAAESKYHAALQAAKKAVGVPEFARFILSFRTWSRCPPAALASAAEQPVKRIAPWLLDRLEGKFDKRLKRSDGQEPGTLHAVRKSAKKLRYSIEYLDALFGSKAARYAKACNRLQKKLGVLNDLETATARAAELAGNDRLDLVPAVGALSNWADARRPPLLKKALKACATFAEQDPFWQ